MNTSIIIKDTSHWISVTTAEEIPSYCVDTMFISCIHVITVLIELEWNSLIFLNKNIYEKYYLQCKKGVLWFYKVLFIINYSVILHPTFTFMAYLCNCVNFICVHLEKSKMNHRYSIKSHFLQCTKSSVKYIYCCWHTCDCVWVRSSLDPAQ